METSNFDNEIAELLKPSLITEPDDFNIPDSDPIQDVASNDALDLIADLEIELSTQLPKLITKFLKSRLN